jgi:hypothetical protein
MPKPRTNVSVNFVCTVFIASMSNIIMVELVTMLSYAINMMTQ